MAFHILAINPGSTSTKIALFEDDQKESETVPTPAVAPAPTASPTPTPTPTPEPEKDENESYWDQYWDFWGFGNRWPW